MPARVRLCLGLMATALAAGCATSVRIRKDQALFYALQPRVQEEIRNGIVKIGFTAEMVYLALGRPSRVESDATVANGETWIYDRYVTDPRVQHGGGPDGFIPTGFYAETKRLSVVFSRGRVVAVKLSD